MEGVEELYRLFGVLADAKDNINEHEDSYASILNFVKGTPGEKRLASTFITRFFKNFPKLQDQAIDALLDLCEDEDIAIRKQTIKDFPKLCQDEIEHLPRIADVLTQLLQADDVTELTTVRNSLLSLFKMDAKGTIGGIFSQILSGEEHVRDKAIKFLSSTVTQYGKQYLHPKEDTERYIVDEIKKAFSDVNGEEFTIFMSILSKLKIMSGAHQELADIVTEQAELNQPFQVSEQDSIDRFISCARQGLPFFAKGASAEPFFSYLLEQILPHFSECGDSKLELLKLLAEMSPCGLKEETIKAAIEPVFTLLLEYMPLPPAEDSEDKKEEGSEPKLQFSFVECLLYAFHSLAKNHQEFLTGDEATERLKDFRLRLQYFAQGCQIYIKQIKIALQGKTGAALQEEENKMKVAALRTTNNINTIIKDLFHNPPAYKTFVSLSWKSPSKVNVSTSSPPQPSAEQNPELDEKRKRAGITPITFDIPPEKKSATNQASRPKPRKSGGFQVYMPPGRRSGAANGKVQGQSMPDNFSGNRRGGRGRGGRGRGRGRF
ncbi:apoptosis inhibitor 5-like [Actinia tenebrosa]|uniref:Apoptosis inhibitor 5-like n=1 Tax=Actinia tenebrosa TaxID=6105 RepID=A0A6P8J5X7_ACTTE|nr:apoptosis inhibitor 5-like [Actinia tenebrosa]